MKKFHRSISFFLAASVVLTMFCLSGCSKNNPDGSASLNTTSATSSVTSTSASATEISTSDSAGGTGETSASQGTDDASETGDISGPSTATSAVPSETTSPDDGSSGVKVHWDSYKSATPKMPDPVINWYYGKPKDDFIPSKDYGKIYFYTGFGANSHSANYLNVYGCIDQNGRVICSPFANDFYDVEGGGYYVVRHVNVDDVEESKRHLIYKKIGYLSADGSVYSGISYDSLYTQDGVIHFVNYTDTGIHIVTFDKETGQTKDLMHLVFDYKKIPQDMDFYRVVKDRYLVFGPDSDGDYEDPTEGNKRVLIDGTTGKVIPTTKYQTIVGDRLLKQESADGSDEWSEDKEYIYTLSDYSGKTIWKKTYRDYSILGNDRILFGTASGWELLDLEGNVIGTLQDGDQYIGDSYSTKYVSVYNGKISLSVYYDTEDYSLSKECYFDKDLNLIDCKEYKKSRLHFDSIRVSETVDEDFNNVTELWNIKTDKTVNYKDCIRINDAGDYLAVTISKTNGVEDIFSTLFLDPSDFRVVKELEGTLDDYAIYDNIFIITKDDSFLLLDPKDLHVLTERKGTPRTFTDDDGKTIYVVVFYETMGEKYWITELLDILDPATGKSIFSSPIPDEYFSLISGVTLISDGKVLVRDSDFNMMLDRNGSVLFFWEVFHGDAEHYTDDSVWNGEEPDEP